MTYTTISIKERTKDELKKLNLFYKASSMDELLRILIVQANEKYINDFSKDFQLQLKERNLTLEDIIKSGDKIREQILKEKH